MYNNHKNYEQVLRKTTDSNISRSHSTFESLTVQYIAKFQQLGVDREIVDDLRGNVVAEMEIQVAQIAVPC